MGDQLGGCHISSVSWEWRTSTSGGDQERRDQTVGNEKDKQLVGEGEKSKNQWTQVLNHSDWDDSAIGKREEKQGLDWDLFWGTRQPLNRNLVAVIERHHIVEQKENLAHFSICAITELDLKDTMFSWLRAKIPEPDLLGLSYSLAFWSWMYYSLYTQYLI